MKSICKLVAASIILLASTICSAQEIVCETPAVNLIAYSDDMTSATGWTKVSTWTDDTATTTPPEGIFNVNKTFKSASGASQTNLSYGAALSAYVVNGVLYRATVYVKYSNAQYLAVGFGGGGFYGQAFDIQNGVVGTTNAFTESTITSAGNGWYKISFIYSGNTSLSPGFRMQFKILNSNVYSDTKTTAGTEIVYFSSPHVQTVSQSLKINQYIPTTTAVKAWGNPICPAKINPYSTSN